MPDTVDELIDYANLHYELAQQALRDGDLATYQAEIDLVGQALQELDRAIQLDRENFYAYVAAYSTLNDGGQRERALSYLERWLQIHPEDNETRQLVEGQRGGSSIPLPRPPPPASGAGVHRRRGGCAA